MTFTCKHVWHRSGRHTDTGAQQTAISCSLPCLSGRSQMYMCMCLCVYIFICMADTPQQQSLDTVGSQIPVSLVGGMWTQQLQRPQRCSQCCVWLRLPCLPDVQHPCTHIAQPVRGVHICTELVALLWPPYRPIYINILMHLCQVS